MNKITRTREGLKNEVLNYMAHNCSGFRNAQKKDAILKDINDILAPACITERTLRLIFAVLRREKHIASHNSNPAGHWMIPICVANDPEEIEAVLRSLKEKRAKALNLLNGVSGEIGNLEDKLKVAKGIQGELSLTR